LLAAVLASCSTLLASSNFIDNSDTSFVNPSILFCNSTCLGVELNASTISLYSLCHCASCVFVYLGLMNCIDTFGHQLDAFVLSVLEIATCVLMFVSLSLFALFKSIDFISYSSCILFVLPLAIAAL
jgi:hypothetical protein